VPGLGWLCAAPTEFVSERRRVRVAKRRSAASSSTRVAARDARSAPQRRSSAGRGRHPDDTAERHADKRRRDGAPARDRSRRRPWWTAATAASRRCRTRTCGSWRNSVSRYPESDDAVATMDEFTKLLALHKVGRRADLVRHVPSRANAIARIELDEGERIVLEPVHDLCEAERGASASGGRGVRAGWRGMDHVLVLHYGLADHQGLAETRIPLGSSAPSPCATVRMRRWSWSTGRLGGGRSRPCRTPTGPPGGCPTRCCATRRQASAMCVAAGPCAGRSERLQAAGPRVPCRVLPGHPAHRREGRDRVEVRAADRRTQAPRHQPRGAPRGPSAGRVPRLHLPERRLPGRRARARRASGDAQNAPSRCSIATSRPAPSTVTPIASQRICGAGGRSRRSVSQLRAIFRT
jgi:hypothetical protein